MKKRWNEQKKNQTQYETNKRQCKRDRARFLVLSFLLCVCVFWSPVQIPAKQVLAEDVKQASVNNYFTGKLYAKSAVLMDGDSGRILYEKEGMTPLPMASTTKIMTCILALEYGEMEGVVTFSEYAASQPKVHLGAGEGEQFLLRDLLLSLMLESHNDSAVAIAEHISGSVPAFAAKMNEKAKELNLGQTHFVTPNGLDDADEGGAHQTTAAELARLMKYCIQESPQKEAFLQITQTKSYTFSDLEKKHTYTCTNKNAFLDMMEGALSGKTGFTSDAGYCYVGALRKDGKTLIVALLACGWPNHKTYKWKDTIALMEHGLQEFRAVSLQELLETAIQEQEETANPTSCKVEVDEGRGDAYTSPYERAKVSLTLDAQEVEKLSERTILVHKNDQTALSIQVPDTLQAPVMKGKKIGSAALSLNETVLCRLSFVTTEAISRWTYKDEFAWILEKYMAVF